MTTWLLPPYSGATFQTASRNIIAATLGSPTPFGDSDVAAALAQGWTYSSNAPVEQLGKLIGIPAAVQTGYDGKPYAIYDAKTNQSLPIQQSNGQRPRLLVFGNSLAGISSTVLVGTTTTVPTATSAGALTVTVAAIGSIVNGSKLAFSCYDGTPFYTTVNGAPAGNVVTLASPLPKLLRAGSGVTLYTTDFPANIRQNSGPMYQALAMLGMPVDLVQGYGYGGGTIQEIVLDLPHVLQDVRPQYVHLMLAENSMTLSGEQLIAYTKMAIETCLSYGAIPMVNTPYPSTSYTAGAMVASFDALTAYIINTMPIEYPNAISLNVGLQWVDPAQPTLRTPLVSWTDGIHPNGSRYVQIGKFYRNQLLPYFNSPSKMFNKTLSTNPLLTGTGGTASNLQGGSIVPVGYNITANAGVTTTTSRNADGSLKVVMSVAGTSNVSTTQTTITLPTVTLGANVGSRAQAAMSYFKVKVNTMTGVDFLQLSLNYGDGTTYSSNQQIAGIYSNAEALGETYHLESPYQQVPFSAVNVTSVLAVRPTTGLSNGVFVDIDIYEAGIVPVSYVTP